MAKISLIRICIIFYFINGRSKTGISLLIVGLVLIMAFAGMAMPNNTAKTSNETINVLPTETPASWLK